ncbi:hypothetical protein [Caudoviricetes sp.]|nr:hypothetical protein [Caudoviricetes sp.]
MERDGYILLHRKGLSKEEWKHPMRTLAWIDFLTMAAWKEFTAPDGVHVGLGQVIASYGFLATRWGVSKDTAFNWIKHWIAERQVERLPERCTERSAERFFVVNYAKYQNTTELVAERLTKRGTERTAEQMKVKHVKENREIQTPETGQVNSLQIEIEKHLGREEIGIDNPKAYLAKLLGAIGNDWPAVKKAWGDWKRGNGIGSAAEFWTRAKHYHVPKH